MQFTLSALTTLAIVTLAVATPTRRNDTPADQRVRHRGTSCSAQPVCCTNDSFNGVVALGCTPININL
ncbi:hydrophobin-251 [Pholiota molesta]|nr:hydrophobin-251 [Pholiota molesta]